VPTLCWVLVVCCLAVITSLVLVPPPSTATTPLPPNVCVAIAPDTVVFAVASPPENEVTVLTGGERGFSPAIHFSVAEPVLGFVADTDFAPLVAYSAHSVFALWPARCRRLTIFDTPWHILNVSRVRVPDRRATGLLVLVAETVDPPQPERSHLYLLDPARPSQPTELSPESGYNFWASSVGDVDADGSEDVSLCTWSQTARDLNYARRFFVYSWDDDGDLYPRWRGSRLCRPYTRARLADVTADGISELVSVEVGLGGGQLICTYEWNQFGFWGIGRTEEHPGIESPQIADVTGDAVADIVALVTDPSGVRRPCVFEKRGPRWVLSRHGPPLREDESIVVVPRSDGPARIVTYPTLANQRAREDPLRPVAILPIEGSREDAT